MFVRRLSRIFPGPFFFRRLPGCPCRAVRCRPDLVRVHPGILHLVFCIRHLYPISVSAPIPFQSHSNPIPVPFQPPATGHPSLHPLRSGCPMKKPRPDGKYPPGRGFFSEDFRPFGLLLRSFRSASAPQFDLPVRFPVTGFLPTFRCVRCFLSELPSARRRLSGACTACFRIGLSLPQSLHRPCAETVSRESPPSPAAPGCAPSPPPDGFRPRRNAADIPGRCRRYKDRRIPWAMRSTFSARDSR